MSPVSRPLLNSIAVQEPFLVLFWIKLDFEFWFVASQKNLSAESMYKTWQRAHIMRSFTDGFHLPSSIFNDQGTLLISRFQPESAATPEADTSYCRNPLKRVDRPTHCLSRAHAFPRKRNRKYAYSFSETGSDPI